MEGAADDGRNIDQRRRAYGLARQKGTERNMEQHLARLERAAARCEGTIKNPRYFAESLVYALAPNPLEQDVAARELADAVERIADLQSVEF